MFEWRPKTSDIPTAAGVYRYWDETGRVIYVGKAKNLRNRISSYFADLGGTHPRTLKMLQTAVTIDWVVVNSEVEALQLEHAWINEYDPRFNVRFKDDKSYPWLAISLNEKFPRIFLYRGERKPGLKYFGPYIQAWQVRETIDRILRVYPVRTCSTGVFQRAAKSGNPCLLGYIGKCDAPCVGRISPEDHRALMGDLISLINGKTKPAIDKLTLEMKTAAAALEFEKATAARDAIESVEWITQRSAVVLDSGVSLDAFAISNDELAAAVQVFYIRDGKVVGQRSLLTDMPLDVPSGEVLFQAMLAIYSDADEDSRPPKIVLSNFLPKDFETASSALSKIRGGAVEMLLPQRGSKADLIDTVKQNADAALALYRSRRGADLASRGKALSEIADYLELPSQPLRIECIDISHHAGEAVVASLVVFEDGLPSTKDYRSYVLKHGQGNNDVLSVSEIVERRFANDDAKKYRYPPSLFIVDGGAPQVNAAAKAMQALGVQVPVVGIAKRLEEVWLPQQSDPIIFPRTSDGLFLIQRIRDEAHRVAITHSQKRMQKVRKRSILEEIPGVGEKRAKVLIKHFGSVKQIRAAKAEDLQAVNGISHELAEQIISFLNAQNNQAINVTTGEIVDGA
jgi:excinuclease ABC subunit C